MPFLRLGGTQYKRNSDPTVSNLADAKGLYPWTMLYAHLCQINGEGNVESVPGIADETEVDMLLFLSDIPAFGQVKCYHAGATNAPYFADLVNEPSVPFLVTASGGATPVSVDIGQVAIGYTGTAGAVPCSGFPTSTIVNVVGVASVDEAAVLVWSNGAVMCAPVSQNKDAGSTLVPQPILLYHDQYDPAYLASNNIFTDASGFKWLIVGLHNAQTD